VDGGTNWWPPTYDPNLHLLMVPVLERSGIFFSSNDWTPQTGRPFFAGSTAATGDGGQVGVVAINPEDGTVVWRHLRPASSTTERLGGLLSTATGLTFASDQEQFYVLASATGDLLWSFQAGGPIVSAPVTYEADGTQYVAVTAGRTLVAFALVGTP